MTEEQKARLTELETIGWKNLKGEQREEMQELRKLCPPDDKDHADKEDLVGTPLQDLIKELAANQAFVCAILAPYMRIHHLNCGISEEDYKKKLQAILNLNSRLNG